MSGIFARLVAWFANDVIVKTLSNSKRFQRFAVNMDTNLNKTMDKINNDGVKKIIEEKVVEAKDLHKTFDPKATLKNFITDINEEIAKHEREAIKSPAKSRK